MQALVQQIFSLILESCECVFVSIFFFTHFPFITPSGLSMGTILKM